MRISDWSSDVCSSDLEDRHEQFGENLADLLLPRRRAHKSVADRIVGRECRIGKIIERSLAVSGTEREAQITRRKSEKRALDRRLDDPLRLVVHVDVRATNILAAARAEIGRAHV